MNDAELMPLAERLKTAIGARDLSAAYGVLAPLSQKDIEPVMLFAGFTMIGWRSREFGEYVQRQLADACKR